MILLQWMMLILLPAQKFSRPPFWHCGRYYLGDGDSEVQSSVTEFRSAVQMLLERINAHRRTWRFNKPIPLQNNNSRQTGTTKRLAIPILLLFSQKRWLKELHTGRSNFDLLLYSMLHNRPLNYIRLICTGMMTDIVYAVTKPLYCGKRERVGKCFNTVIWCLNNRMWSVLTKSSCFVLHGAHKAWTLKRT